MSQRQYFNEVNIMNVIYQIFLPMIDDSSSLMNLSGLSNTLKTEQKL